MKKFLVLIAAVLLACGNLTGCGNSRSTLEENAKPLVSQIIKEQLNGDAQCLKVKITDKVDNTHYKAVATLDNGNDLNIMIEDRGDMIYVTIPEQ